MLILGKSGCGKTNLINRFIENTFTDSHVHIEGNLITKDNINLEGEQVTLQICEHRLLLNSLKFELISF